MVLPMINNMNDSHSSKTSSTNRSGVVLAYVIFATIAVLVYHLVAEGEFSSILTLSTIFQSLAFILLVMQAFATGSMHGISVKSLQLDAVAIACRLSSTTWLQGYLPSDQTGDFLYQAFDALSLCMVLWLVYHALSDKQAKYDTEQDSLSTAPFMLGALVLAFLLHGDLNDNTLFDALWMCGLFLSAVSVLPQLWLMTHSRTSVPALTSHFVAVMAFSRILSGTYMWHAHSEITCEPWIGDFNHAGYAILTAHAVHLMLLGDFAYFYGKNLATAGLHSPLELPEAFLV